MKNPSQLLKFTQMCLQLATQLDRFHALTDDKGYDDRSYRSRLRSWGKRPLIKHRGFAPYDKAANARMDPELYRRRSRVETVISVMKRKYGAAVSSRVGWRRFRELVAMGLVYNVERAVKRGVAFLDRLLSQLLYFLQQRISTEASLLIEAETREELWEVIERQMIYYNERRRHSRLNDRPPMGYLKFQGIYVDPLARTALSTGAAVGAQAPRIAAMRPGVVLPELFPRAQATLGHLPAELDGEIREILEEAAR